VTAIHQLWRTLGLKFVLTAGSLENPPSRAGQFGTVCRAVKVREVIRLLERDGWHLERQSGSHRQYRHATKPGTVTVAGNLGNELKPGTLASVLRQAGLKGPRT
jgi:predicted RNA binding protein YcfA (HicA-like mRNA interferase family)